MSKHRDPTREEFMELLALLDASVKSVIGAGWFTRVFYQAGAMEIINKYMKERLPKILYEDEEEKP